MKREREGKDAEREEEKKGVVGNREGKMAETYHNLDQTSQLSSLSSPRFNCRFAIAKELLKSRQVQLQIQFDA